MIFSCLVILPFLATLCRLTAGQYRELLSRSEIDVFGKNDVKITVYLVDDIRQRYTGLLNLPLLVLKFRLGDCNANDRDREWR